MARVITWEKLLDQYDAILIDAYGVLVTGRGAIEGADELIRAMSRRQLPYVVVTNDASRLPETHAKRFRSFGLDIDEDRFITSGGLLVSYFSMHRLEGARCLLLGTEESAEYVRRAGGVVVDPLASNVDYDVLIVADDDGYDFLQGVEAAMTSLFRLISKGRSVRLLLPNPDVIYPKDTLSFGLASGAVALVIEAALERRFSTDQYTFERLGKPHAPLFEAAIQRLGTRNAVMIGDQIETDIAGANAVGLDSALVQTGIALDEHVRQGSVSQPTWLLRKEH